MPASALVDDGPAGPAPLRSERARPLLRRSRPFALVVLAGVLGVLAFPPFGFWPLAILSVAVFSVALSDCTARRGALLGYLYGWVFFGLLLRWTGTFVGPVWLLLPFAEAGFFALLGAALVVLQRRRLAWLWIGAAWTAEEALRDRLPFGGFPWGRWAFSQAESPLRWFAAVGGAPLVTAVVAVAGGALARSTGWARRRHWRRGLVALAPAVTVLLVGAALAVVLTPGRPAHRLTIALVQGNVPDRGLEFNARRRQVLNNHVNETLRLAAEIHAGTVPKPDLVVWPENASDIDPFLNPDARAVIDQAVAAVGVPILVGAVLDGPGPDHVSNVGIMWSPTTGPGAQYAKRHPVPFGEYLPFRAVATAITSKAALIARDMAAGHGNGVVTGGPVPLGDVICFEVAYDGLVRSSVRGGAQLIVVQTNNATFGHSAETYQQLAMSRLRAVENRRTVVQVATSGKSAIIAPDGSIVAESGRLFTAAVIVRSVPLEQSFTLATRVQYWPELLLSVLAAIGLAGSIITDRRRRSRANSAGRRAADADADADAEVSPTEERITA